MSEAARAMKSIRNQEKLAALYRVANEAAIKHGAAIVAVERAAAKYAEAHRAALAFKESIEKGATS